MAGSYVMILRGVIAAGVAGVTLSDFRFVQFFFSGQSHRKATTL